MTMPPPLIPTYPEPHGPPSAAGSHEGAAWHDVLARVGWPTTVVVIDFETFFSDSYHMGKSKGSLSTIEYIMDSRYEEVGVACLQANSTKRQTACFWPSVEEQLAWLQRQYGKNLEECTCVIQNARFDGSILVRKHSITPPYCVDTIALSRHLDARNTHNLRDLCLRWGLPQKGDTMQFSGKHWPTMTRDEQLAMSEYSINDAERTLDLFEILLPKLTRPEVELKLQLHTLRLFTQPELCFDFALAEELLGKMDQEVDKALESVAWVLE
jgi:DNA polymerase I-like protein with 3'-5' exonuclease and polymerase domains